MRIKNWHEFQHYKDRDPKWIKLYKKLLDDPEWHKLDGQSAKVLVMLWLLASEENGVLPAIPEIAFRLRVPEKSITSICCKLSHWLLHAASTPLAEPYQHDSLELEKEGELEKEKETPLVPLQGTTGFHEFWDAYPKKVGKDAALRAWRKAKHKPSAFEILAAIEQQKQSEQWQKENGQFIPNPATWLNQGRWADRPVEVTGLPDPSGMMAGFKAFLERGTS